MRIVYLSLIPVALLLGVLVLLSERPQARANRGTLPMTFAHADHGGLSCAGCHHNFVDAVGFGGQCLDCHQTDASVAHLVEVQFHDLCRGCHVEQRAAGEASGPVRQCRACHTREDEP